MRSHWRSPLYHSFHSCRAYQPHKGSSVAALHSGRRIPDTSGTGAGRASRGRDRLCYTAEKASPSVSYVNLRRSTVNKPVISQTSSMVDVSQSVDAHAPLLRVCTFGTFRLDWQVPPFTT